MTYSSRLSGSYSETSIVVCMAQNDQPAAGTDRQLQTLQERERYRTASLFLGIILVAVVGVLVYKQVELSNVYGRLENCIQEQMKLERMTGACGETQIQQLDVLRAENLKLTEVKGKCLVHEETLKEWASRENSSTALVAKQADDLLQLLLKDKDATARTAEQRENCEKDLKHLQTETYQLLQNITLLVQGKEEYYQKYQMCMEKITSYEQQEQEKATST